MMHIGGSFFGENAGLDPNDTNAIKEQANLLLELVPKQEWSEEDGKMLNSAIYACKYMVDNFENSTKQYEDAITWLKSLRSQNRWKPSDEQMKMVDKIIL